MIQEIKNTMTLKKITMRDNKGEETAVNNDKNQKSI